MSTVVLAPPATELLDRHQISYRWDDASQRILVDTIDLVPTFREEAVQRSLGWPIFELSIQSGAAPVLFGGHSLVRDGGG